MCMEKNMHPFKHDFIVKNFKTKNNVTSITDCLLNMHIRVNVTTLNMGMVQNSDWPNAM